MLLIRDWGCPEEFSYGDEGGSRYVDMQLEVCYSSPKNLSKNIFWVVVMFYSDAKNLSFKFIF